MKKKLKQLGLLVISIIVFAACIGYGTKIKEDLIVSQEGYVDDGMISSMNMTSFYGFTETSRDKGIYLGHFRIPEDGSVEFKVKASTGGGDEFLISFKDEGGNIIFEEKSNSIFYSKIIDSKAGEWYFQINGKDVRTGDFKYAVVKK